MSLKLPFKIYLTTDELYKLKEISKEHGFEGQGAISHFLSMKLCKEQFVFIDSNARKLLKALDLKPKT